MSEAPRGLENVVVASTALSTIDGTAGRLSYAGYDIHSLAGNATFEEVFFLLLRGDLPNAYELAEFRSQLAAQRELTAEEYAFVRGIPREGHGMDALRTLVSGLLQRQPEVALSAEEAERVGLLVAAKMPALIATWHRLRTGLEPIAPNSSLDHAANMLWMLHGEPPTAAAERAFDTYLVLLAEHGLNASTFAARVAIGAQSDVGSALVGAIATLKGLVHGGANQKAMETFLAIGTPEQAPAYIEGLLQRHERLMGVGHRIYKVEDPRVRHLRSQVATLAEAGQGAQWQAVADAVAGVIAEHPHFKRRQLAPNVEFYSAPLLYALGIPLDLFTCAFALSRVAGWTAHIREQIADNRLIRPKAEYNGPAPRAFVAIEDR
jgi:citrate synthase